MYVSGDMPDYAVGHKIKAGDRFDAKAASDVLIDGLVVVRKDSAGGGSFVIVRNNGKNELTMKPLWVYAADGTMIRLLEKDPAAPWINGG